MQERSFQLVRAGEEKFEFELMIYGGRLTDRQPLLMVHSIEFAMPPSGSFCEMMWQAGLQVIFVRRAGFGKSSRIPDSLMTKEHIQSRATAMIEAVMLRALISKLALQNIVLLAIGSSNPISFRLLHLAPEITRVIMVNPPFNQDIFPVFHPPWFRQMLMQMISSESGVQVAESGMKMMIRNDPVSFYRTVLKKSAGDTAYVEANQDDYFQAGHYALETSGRMLYCDAIMSLTEDELLKDGFFNGAEACVLIGADSVDLWKHRMWQETDRLGLPLYLAPRGDIFCAHICPETVIALIHNEAPLLQDLAYTSRHLAEPGRTGL